MNSNVHVSDKFSMIKNMLSGHKEAISIESRYIMKVDILDVVKDHSLIEIGLGVDHCFEWNSFFKDSPRECDQNQIANFFTIFRVEESIYLRENRVYVHYVGAQLLLGEELIRKFLNRTLKPSDL